MYCLRELIYVIKIFKTNLIAWKRHLIPKIWSWHCNSFSYSYSPRNSVALCLQHLPSSVSLAPCDIFLFRSDSVCAILCLWLFQWPGFAIHSNAHLRHASQDLSVQAPFLHLCLADVWPFLISVNLVSFPWLCDPISLQQWTLLGSLHLNYKSDTQPSYKYLCLSDNGNSRSYPAFVISQNRKPATHRAYCYSHHLYWPAMCFLGQWSRPHIMLMVLLFIQQTFIECLVYHALLKKLFTINQTQPLYPHGIYGPVQSGGGWEDRFKKIHELPRWSSSKEPPCQCKRQKRHRFDT